MKLSNRAPWRGLAAVLLVLMLIGVVACNSEPVFQKYNRVYQGMTYDEVVRIMGDPQGYAPRDTTGPVNGKYTWGDSGGVAELYFEDGSLRSKVWMGWP